jgi:8-oxo-dGTP diphosphatase
MSELPTIKAVAAIIMHEGKVFAARRCVGKDYDGWWEFPGGKIEPGESDEEACRREIQEELSLEVQILRHYYSVDYIYPQFRLLMECFLCIPTPTSTHSIDNLKLSAHDDYRWLSRANLYEVKWLPAAFDVLKKMESEGIIR